MREAWVCLAENIRQNGNCAHHGCTLIPRPMKCPACGGEMIGRNRIRLFLVGLGMAASLALVLVIPRFLIPGVILAAAGAYLMVWATLGRGLWCRNCKKFSIP